MPPARVSGLQKEVFALYRSVLRAARNKDHVIGGKDTYAFARSEFRKAAGSVKRTDFDKIEFMVRQGKKQLRLLSMPGVQRASSVG